jgi:hypothetical protein
MCVGVPINLHVPASIEAGIARGVFSEIDRRIARSRRSGASCRKIDIPVTA